MTYTTLMVHLELGRPNDGLLKIAGDAYERDRALVAWKDTRDTRRAVSDALPLLKHAAGVTVVEIATGADVVVAGAYGHSRLREWVLGGVTRDLLLSANRCALVSH